MIKPQELRDHATDDHRKGCPAQNHLCTCDYDKITERLLRAAAKRIRGTGGHDARLPRAGRA